MTRLASEANTSSRASWPRPRVTERANGLSGSHLNALKGRDDPQGWISKKRPETARCLFDSLKRLTVSRGEPCGSQGHIT